MTLSDYLKTKRLDVEEFALAAEVHRSTVYRALNGDGCSRRTAARMSAATGGEVSAAEIIGAQKIPDLDDDTDPIRRAS